MDALVAVVMLAAVLFYFGTGFAVGSARRASGIKAPAMTGDPRLERAVRVHYNTLEWMPIFLATLWVFAAFVPAPYGSYGAAGLGVIWIVGRAIYMRGYMADPSKRTTGFMIQGLACVVLLLGGLGGALYRLSQGG